MCLCFYVLQIKSYCGYATIGFKKKKKVFTQKLNMPNFTDVKRLLVQ